MMDPHPNVLCVDDDPLVLGLFLDALGAGPCRPLVASSAQEALEVFGLHTIDVVVSSERMPGMRGCELLVEVKNKFPDTIRVLMSDWVDADTAMKAINESEVHRFFSKPCPRRAFVRIIDEALALRAPAPTRAAPRPDPALLSRLSTREGQIASELVAGHRIAEIAGALSISAHTVRNHIKSAFKKLGVHSQTELVSRLLGAH